MTDIAVLYRIYIDQCDRIDVDPSILGWCMYYFAWCTGRNP